MKKLIIITAILITGFINTAKSESKIINHPGFEFGFFYSNLAPYGTWIEIDGGLVVWRPTIIKRGWAPYRQGRWIWTVDGWYWDSYEPFGYIVFHYGRWYYDDYYGWIWIPDYDWAPAWVDWRYDDDYIGWAPLPPYAIFMMNIGIYYTNDYYVPYHHWHFVGYRHFCDPYVYNYYAAPKYRYRIYNRTKYRNNYGYRDGRIVNNGVDVDYVRQRTGQDIRQRDIMRVNDYKEVEKYRGKETEAVRTFVTSREELTRTGLKDVNIEKRNKRSSLDVSKVRLGKDNTEIREHNSDVVKQRQITTEKNIELEKKSGNRNEVIIKEKSKNNPEIRRENKTEVKENKNIQTERKKEYNIVPEKKTERQDVKKFEINKNGNTDENRKTEVKRENVNNSKPNYEKQRNENKVQVKTEVKRNNDSNRNQGQDKVERKSNTDNTKKRSR